MKHLILVRGGGDIATGTIHRLHNAGYAVLVLEDEKPSAIRREVAFCEAVYDGVKTVERVTCRLAANLTEARHILKEGDVAMLVDPQALTANRVKHEALVDAILAKRNLGTTRAMAPITIGLGPGFCAGRDVDWVVETMRGHNLGRIIREGFAMKNTGVPGVIAGFGAERVIHAPADGRLETRRTISMMVQKGEAIAQVYGADGTITDVPASLDGILRGIIRDGYMVRRGLKIADIDPRPVSTHCFTISDKARCIAGSVLELVLGHERGIWQ